jgi:galactokinase
MTEFSLNQLVSLARSSFHQTYSQTADIVAVAPGRVNLIGEHIDYNGGLVLPFAIDRYTLVAGRRGNSRQIRVSNPQLKDTIVWDRETYETPATESWSRYLFGVFSEWEQLGLEMPGFDALVCSNIPIGVGLSSSAALEVAMATFLEAVSETGLERMQKALLCHRAEIQYVGVPCGNMDQIASVFGEQEHVVAVECQKPSVELIPLPDDRQFTFAITNSKAERSLAKSEYALRRLQTASALKKIGKLSYLDVNLADLAKVELSPTEHKRARHVITEISRSYAARERLCEGDCYGLGELIFQSHASLRDDCEVSCQELDLLVDAAREMCVDCGVIGSKMIGGGFGGCTITLLDLTAVDPYKQAVSQKFFAATGILPDIFTTRPSAGAHIV